MSTNTLRTKRPKITILGSDLCPNMPGSCLKLLPNSVPWWSHDCMCHCLLLNHLVVQLLFCCVSTMSKPFKWNSPTGQTLCWNILKGTPLGINPTIGKWKVFAKVSMVLISSQSHWLEVEKRTTLPLYPHCPCHIKNPSLCLTTKFPKDPCLIVICPTILLQLEMVCA